MDLDGIFNGMSVAGSGLLAERTRLDVIAKNIANANVVAGPDGEPYRRQSVSFETVLDDALEPPGSLTGSVRVAEITSDYETPLKEVYDPNHPMADAEGMVRYSNVDMAFEMIDLITASRAYEANLKSISAYRDMVRESLRIMER